MTEAFGPAAPRLFKAVAAGNDFLVADARQHPGWDPGADGTRLMCRRRLGAGADGLVVLGPSRRADASFMLRNSDGSRAAFSGNGARCAALLLHRLGVRRPDDRVDLETETRVAEGRVREGGTGQAARVEISVGAPAELRRDLDLPEGSPVARGDFAVVGVPYLALRVDDPDALDLPAVAPALRRWSALEQGANVAFWRAGEPVRLRTWERGVEGETASSGTGCCMVALAIVLREPSSHERRIEFAPRAGGLLAVTVVREGDAVTDLRLEGEARVLGEVLLDADALLPDA